ncbi:hypothetical protein [Methanobrevibacter curvatus]|uniref:Uncharacterized protein n=1 Tax=Methanobrevibacter curvatus TaxID=49547 RepID=A0A166A1S6_9EURY|nr:hypothetical protein [Methanobrevibacter curvatus]KZX11456.1 hypothetical protein MBCUR_14160 [Methanobrevibacter curvatus]
MSFTDNIKEKLRKSLEDSLNSYELNFSIDNDVLTFNFKNFKFPGEKYILIKDRITHKRIAIKIKKSQVQLNKNTIIELLSLINLTDTSNDFSYQKIDVFDLYLKIIIGNYEFFKRIYINDISNKLDNLKITDEIVDSNDKTFIFAVKSDNFIFNLSNNTNYDFTYFLFSLKNNKFSILSNNNKIATDLNEEYLRNDQAKENQINQYNQSNQVNQHNQSNQVNQYNQSNQINQYNQYNQREIKSNVCSDDNTINFKSNIQSILVKNIFKITPKKDGLYVFLMSDDVINKNLKLLLSNPSTGETIYFDYIKEKKMFKLKWEYFLDKKSEYDFFLQFKNHKFILEKKYAHNFRKMRCVKATIFENKKHNISLKSNLKYPLKDFNKHGM